MGFVFTVVGLVFVVPLGREKFGFCADFKVQMNSEDHPRTLVAKNFWLLVPRKNFFAPD
jgi:hypothetical protein